MGTTILGIAGSLRADSFNRRLLLTDAEDVSSSVNVVLWDRLAQIPAFDEDREADSIPASVADLRRAIRAADAVLIATPEYNRSIPGALKNALDWASRPFATNPLRGKPAAVISASPSPRGGQAAQEDLRRVLRVIGADVVDEGLAVASVHRRLTDDGPDQELRRQLRHLVSVLVDRASAASLAVAS